MCQNCKKPYYITTAIAYTSGKPHIGNTYEIVLADSIARYKRAQGYDVRFQTGTDEHGQKIELKAAEAGITPKQFVDNVAGEIKTIWDLMNTSYDKFIRTTDEDHEKCAKKIFKKLYDQGEVLVSYYRREWINLSNQMFCLHLVSADRIAKVLKPFPPIDETSTLPALMIGVCGADKFVVGCIHQIPDRLDLTRHVIDKLLRRDASLSCL